MPHVSAFQGTTKRVYMESLSGREGGLCPRSVRLVAISLYAICIQQTLLSTIRPGPHSAFAFLGTAVAALGRTRL